jgi:hypothetical protein
LARPRLTFRQLAILILLVQISIFLAVSRFRLVDGDEGFYLMTARLVTEGKLPYHDFLLTQMPLLPYVYGWWMRIAGMTWISARLLSAILTAALGTALYSEVCKRTGKSAAGLLAILLFSSSTQVFAWFTIVKTYALSTLLLFLAYRAVVRCSTASPMTWLTTGGLLLGASADVRLYFAGLLPVFLWWIYYGRKTGARAAAFLCFLGGFALATMPNLYLLARDPQAYFFGNLGFHAIRSNQGLIGGFGNKIITIARLVLAGGEGNGVQMALFYVLILGLAIRSGIVTGAARLALTLGLVLSLICLLPTPPFVQYFCVTVPFFIVFVVCSMSKLLDTLQDGKKKRYLLAACAITLLVFMASAIPDYHRFLITGHEVIGIIEPGRAFNWRISAISAVSQAIDERIRPGERVMSLWPGYIFQSKAEPYAGLENNSATFLAERLSAAQQARYHILSPGSILADIAAHVPKLVVLGNQESMLVEPEPFEKMLVRSGYKVASKIGDSKLWMVAPAGGTD